MNYRILWEIELEAGSAMDAAKLARTIQLDPDSLATCFTVQSNEEPILIDILDGCSRCDGTGILCLVDRFDGTPNPAIPCPVCNEGGQI